MTPTRASGDDERDREQRQQGADGERERGGERRVPRAGDVVGVDAQLDLGVRTEGVVRRQPLGDLERQVLGEPAVDVEGGELLQLVGRVLGAARGAPSRAARARSRAGC